MFRTGPLSLILQSYDIGSLGTFKKITSLTDGELFVAQGHKI